MTWMQCEKNLPIDSKKRQVFMYRKGAQYGKNRRADFYASNLACQRSRIADGCERLKRGVEAYLSQK